MEKEIKIDKKRKANAQTNPRESKIVKMGDRKQGNNFRKRKLENRS